MGGGGAWSRNFSLSRQETLAVAQQAHHVLVLPTTYDLPPAGLDNVTYFSRDRFSSLKAVHESLFCHDMAFFTDIKVREPSERAWKLFAMRNDREGHGYGQHFHLNFDVSMLGDGDYRFVDPFFNIINNFKVISTDRMHIAIAAGMLGLQVNLVPGNYPKSSDVYRSSIQDAYSNVRLKSIEDVLRWHEGK